MCSTKDEKDFKERKKKERKKEREKERKKTQKIKTRFQIQKGRMMQLANESEGKRQKLAMKKEPENGG